MVATAVLLDWHVAAGAEAHLSAPYCSPEGALELSVLGCGGGRASCASLPPRSCECGAATSITHPFVSRGGWALLIIWELQRLPRWCFVDFGAIATFSVIGLQRNARKGALSPK